MITQILRRAFIAAGVVLCGISVSIECPKGGGLSLDANSAQARVGRPLTPLSYAGVARRTHRRAVVGGAVVGGAAYCHRVLVHGVWVCG